MCKHDKQAYDDGKERYYTAGDFADLIRNEQGYYHVTASELQAIWQNGGR
ncbi:MAG: hypothetical protein PHS82_02265 [Lachnospiraceae bacterium]|nr:hypothetical protein [Lachnospiraceae bacterium]